jgi:hypothetical protein
MSNNGASPCLPHRVRPELSHLSRGNIPRPLEKVRFLRSLRRTMCSKRKPRSQGEAQRCSSLTSAPLERHFPSRASRAFVLFLCAVSTPRGASPRSGLLPRWTRRQSSVLVIGIMAGRYRAPAGRGGLRDASPFFSCVASAAGNPFLLHRGDRFLDAHNPCDHGSTVGIEHQERR